MGLGVYLLIVFAIFVTNEFDMKKVSEYEFLCDFQKDEESDKIYWTSTLEYLDEYLFSFDKQTIFNLFEDYPHNLTPEQKEIFDKENPFWKNFFGA